jgi:hypothetical protein
VTTDVTQPATIRTSAATQITVFWARGAEVRPSSNALYINPAGEFGGHSMSFLFGQDTADAEQVAVAERVLAGVQRWRDGIVERVDQQRTAVDELAAAREEIARLKAERDGGTEAAEVTA